jgi:hypothetical protein
MERLRLRGLELFYRSRQYAGNYLIGTGVAVLVALCVACPIYDAVAQTSDGTDDGTLTVEECLGKTNASIDPIAEDLMKQGIIAVDLLPTRVTDGMCEEMLKQAADGTPVGRLVAAQNYVQDIKLIEYTIRRATGEAAAKGPDHHFLADKPKGLRRWTLLGLTGVEATPRAATARQTAAEVVAQGDASIADMLDQIEDALIAKGKPRSEAVASAPCSLETALLNATIKKLVRGESLKVGPDPAPKEMVKGDTIPVTLVVSGAIREVYEELQGQYEEVAEASEAKGCPVLTPSMKGDIHEHHFAVNPRQGASRRPITSHDIKWRWDLTAIKEGENSASIFWGYELKHAELGLRPKSTIASQRTITVTAEPVAKVSDSIERNWRWLVPVGITLVVAAAWLVHRRLR